MLYTYAWHIQHVVIDNVATNVATVYLAKFQRTKFQTLCVVMSEINYHSQLYRHEFEVVKNYQDNTLMLMKRKHTCMQ